uniref:MCIN protein n=1 Tax=Cairina moschata TaxID=8855 RepID=A0A8C3GJ58_CAIMO
GTTFPTLTPSDFPPGSLRPDAAAAGLPRLRPVPGRGGDVRPLRPADGDRGGAAVPPDVPGAPRAVLAGRSRTAPAGAGRGSGGEQPGRAQWAFPALCPPDGEAARRPERGVPILCPQLQETLAQRQEELATLRESNVQLKELASQARQLAAVLDKLMLPQCPDGAALPPPLPPPPPPTPAAGSEGAAGVGPMLRSVSEQCRAALRSLAGSPPAKRPRLRGAFRGLRPSRAAPRPSGGGGGELPGAGSLRAALGEEGGIRTLSFPQGNAFTLRTAAGGYRFRWVPR